MPSVEPCSIAPHTRSWNGEGGVGGDEGGGGGGEGGGGLGGGGDNGMQGSEVTEPTTEPPMVEHPTFAVPRDEMYRAEP